MDRGRWPTSTAVTVAFSLTARCIAQRRAVWLARDPSKPTTISLGCPVFIGPLPFLTKPTVRTRARGGQGRKSRYRATSVPAGTGSRTAMIEERFRRKEDVMRAKVGDWLIIERGDVDHRARRGRIEEVRSADGAPPYLVRWVDTGHEVLMFPGPDARVVTPAELAAMDASAVKRFAAVQQEIAGRVRP